MRQQGSHAEAGVGGENAQLNFQFRSTFGIVLHLLEQFFAHLIAQGIRDNDHCALLGVFEVPGIKVPLQGQSSERNRLLDRVAPLGEQGFQILICVDILHQVPQWFKGRGILDLVIGGVKTSVLVVQLIVLFLVLTEDVFETVWTMISSRLDDLVGAAEHLIASAGLLTEVHFAPLFTDLGNGQDVQHCA